MRDKQLKKQAFPGLSLAIAGNPNRAGHWGRPLIVEIGAGKGYFAINLAQLYPHATVVALDAKPPRLWYGATRAESLGLNNIRFVAYDAALMELMFAPSEVDKIWITFPDPYPKKRHIRRRLTAPSFLQIYRKVLAPGGELHLKTDNPDFFDYTLETLKLEGANVIVLTYDLHASELLNDENSFKTSYEETFVAQGLKIRYLVCRF